MSRRKKDRNPNAVVERLERLQRSAHYHVGGWVAPLQPEQFAGSPQADTQDTGNSGDGGGDSST